MIYSRRNRPPAVPKRACYSWDRISDHHNIHFRKLLALTRWQKGEVRAATGHGKVALPAGKQPQLLNEVAIGGDHDTGSP
jgi:hypothetical protein